MNPFLLSPNERLEDWKRLRKEIANADDGQALRLVAEYWGKAPLSVYSYDPEQPDEWPSPWEMVSDGEWSRSTVAIGMEFTLRLAGWDAGRLKLVYFRDYDISEELMILKIDDTLALNYTLNEVVEYPQTNKVILGSWAFRDKKYDALTN